MVEVIALLYQEICCYKSVPLYNILNRNFCDFNYYFLLYSCLLLDQGMSNLLSLKILSCHISSTVSQIPSLFC